MHTTDINRHKSTDMKQAGLHERIHKGFRVWLFETGIRVQQTDFSDKPEGQSTARELSELLDILDRKFLWETQFFFPALALEAPFSVSLLEEEKREAESLVRSLGRLVRQYQQPGTLAHTRHTGLAIQEAYHKLVSFLMVYMNHQDALFLELSGQREQGDAGLEDIIRTFSVSGNLAEKWGLMLLRSLSFRELVQWLESGRQLGDHSTRHWVERLDPATVRRLREAGVHAPAALRIAA